MIYKKKFKKSNRKGTVMCEKGMLTAKLPFGQKEIIPCLDERVSRPAPEFKSLEPCPGLWTISLRPVFTCQRFLMEINA